MNGNLRRWCIFYNNKEHNSDDCLTNIQLAREVGEVRNNKKQTDNTNIKNNSYMIIEQVNDIDFIRLKVRLNDNIEEKVL